MELALPMADRGVVRALIDSVHEGTSAHAYLFEGEKGLFTCETAMYFAAALLCGSDGEIPCGACDSCIQAASGNNPDIKRMSRTDITDRKSIGADDIRAVISDVYTKPFRAEKKIYIIEDGDALTVQAQNAMLKILEEPPSYAVFIICVTNAELILPTVKSRSRIIRFMPRSDADIKKYVCEKYPHMAQKADFIASFADGIMGRADFLCGDEAVFDMRKKALELMVKLLLGNDENVIFEMCDIFEQYKKESKGGNDTSQMMIDFMLSFLSDILRLINGAENKMLNSDMVHELRKAAERVRYEKADYAARCALEAKDMLAKYVSHKAAVMHLALGMFYGKQN